MEFLQGVGSFTIGTIVPFLFILTLVVFFHELGHFLVARWNGVAVKIFSVGFGRELIGFTDRKGTRWRVSAIPLGGYVRFVGDENAASATGREAITQLDEEQLKTAFISQPVGRRAAIVAAGPIANFILAIVLFAVLYSFFGQPSFPAVVDAVLPESPAAEAGFQPGDRVLAIDGAEIDDFTAFQRIVSLSADRELRVLIDRGGTRVELLVTPRSEETEDRFGNVYRRGLIGIQQNLEEGELTIRYLSVPEALLRGVDETWFVISETVRFVGRLVVGRESLDQLGGPITVARYAGEAASIGFASLLALAAYISVSIGFINLLPIPLLDGGHLLFFGLEAARRRPLSEHAQEITYRIGLVLVLALMVVAFTNDIIRLS